MSFLTNWKTTAAGALSILLGVAGLLGIKGGSDPTASWGMIVAGVGLIFGKDFNVTGT